MYLDIKALTCFQEIEIQQKNQNIVKRQHKLRLSWQMFKAILTQSKGSSYRTKRYLYYLLQIVRQINNLLMAELGRSAQRLDNQVDTNLSNPKAPGSKTIILNRAGGVFLMLILFGAFWIYGWAGEIRYAKSGQPVTGLTVTIPQMQTVLGSLCVLDTIFIVLGFGMLFCYYKKSTSTAIFTTLFTVSFTIILAPILQKFWYNIFMTNFEGLLIKSIEPSRFYHYSLGNTNIILDYNNMRIALANSIAQLVVYLSLFGKLSAFQIVLNSLLFNFLWNFNHFLCVYLNRLSPDLRFFDDYQISNVYLFASVYGFIATHFLKSPKRSKTPEFDGSHNSTMLSHLGTFFLFLSFCTTTTMFTLKTTLTSTADSQTQRSYFWQQAFISIFISMSASITSYYAVNIFINPNGKIGVRGSLIGTITGAIMYGSIAGVCNNIGAAIAVGIIAGGISSAFFEKIYPELNRKQIRDTFGIVNIFIVSFIGTFIVAPTVIKTYYNYDSSLPTLGNKVISNKDVAGWSLVYVGVSIGVGLAGGLVNSLILYLVERKKKNYNDSNLFYLVYQLRVEAEGQQEQP